MKKKQKQVKIDLVLDLETGGMSTPFLNDNGEWVFGASFFPILELAWVLLDDKMKPTCSGSYYIEQSQEMIDRITPDTYDFHEKNGFWIKYYACKRISLAEACGKVVKAMEVASQQETVPLYVFGNDVLFHLLGKSVHFDKAFLEHQIPEFGMLFSHQLLDISSVKNFMRKARPKLIDLSHTKVTHMAIDDCHAAIDDAELFVKWVDKKLPTTEERSLISYMRNDNTKHTRLVDEITKTYGLEAKMALLPFIKK